MTGVSHLLARGEPRQRAGSAKTPNPALLPDGFVRLLGRDRRGTVAVMSGVALSVLAGFAGLAVDAAVWQSNKRNMQGVADSAAYSAAISIAAGGSVTTNGRSIAAQMGYVDGQGGVSVSVSHPPSQGTYAGNGQAVQVTISAPQPTYFTKLYLSSPPTAAATAVALGAVAGNFCVVALDSSASGAVSLQGSAQVDLSGCNLQVDSNNASALSIGGNSQLTADAVAVTGNYSLGTSAQLTAGVIDAPGAGKITDPYASVNIPSYSGCDYHNKNVNSTATLQPGVYCGGLTLNSNAVVTLSAGVYIMDRGEFRVNGGATVTGTGVTIILTSSTGSNYATATIGGGSTVTLTAPTTGTTAGLVFYQDRNAPSNANSTLNGGSGQTFTGALYFPKTTITYSGNSTASACTQIVAGQINFTGNATIQSACTGDGTASITGATTALVQ